jgi:transcriptional regulator
MSIYLPPQFNNTDRSIARALIRENPFASLISTDDAGLPFVSHIPLHFETRPSADGEVPIDVLWGHVAKGNPHWRYLQARPNAVVTFMGPHAYLSPSVYPDLARVPTWNYLAVHCTVEAALIEEPSAKDRLLKKLIGDHEPEYAKQWLGLDDAFAQKMLSAIVGFELRVTALQCKVKVNQHRPESHAAMKLQYASGNENERNLAKWMDRLGLSPNLNNRPEN